MKLSDNLILLRNIHGFSQEQVAETVNVSRQAYAKWEKGDTIPDVEKCAKLADLYGTTIDSLFYFETHQEGMIVPPAPKGKHIYGTVTVSERGQIVIPKQARETFHINTGDRLIVLGDDAQGLAMLKAEVFEEMLKKTMDETFI